ncbi:HEPN domain-containing protein [bacterium]|nr:HEPN domain-containing protein [bacterium]MBU1614103.1 HEPN domain-containing protein [bacterium]
MDELSKKWVERSDYDLKTAEAMLKAERYLYVAFMCQQSLEKLLKAIIVQKGKEILPIHNLVRLAEIAGIYPSMDPGYQDFLADLTPFAIEARYGDYRESLLEIIDQKGAQVCLSKTKEVFKWLTEELKSIE